LLVKLVIIIIWQYFLKAQFLLFYLFNIFGVNNGTFFINKLNSSYWINEYLINKEKADSLLLIDNKDILAKEQSKNRIILNINNFVITIIFTNISLDCVLLINTFYKIKYKKNT
jgi:hypothetical protein